MGKSYETQGRVHSIGPTTEYGQNGFTKREFVILLTGEGENPDYPNYVQFELIKDKCALVDGYQPGYEIKVMFNLGGRLWEGNGNGERCFVGLQAWKVEPVQQVQQHSTQPTQQAPQQYQQSPQPQYQQAPPMQQAPQHQQNGGPVAQQPPMQQSPQQPQTAPPVGSDDFDDQIPF